ncbi:MAG: hypothetical protein ISR45_10440 [Rhodospirillales bacterium]|nr:hypothetical protein [Rhodospirillales bacterium]
MADLTTGVKVKTSASVQQIETLLEGICSGDWDVSIEAIATNLSKKEIAIYFEHAADKEAFKVAFKEL